MNSTTGSGGNPNPGGSNPTPPWGTHGNGQTLPSIDSITDTVEGLSAEMERNRHIMLADALKRAETLEKAQRAAIGTTNMRVTIYDTGYRLHLPRGNEPAQTYMDFRLRWYYRIHPEIFNHNNPGSTPVYRITEHIYANYRR
jgi:hypothetical protein